MSTRRQWLLAATALPWAAGAAPAEMQAAIRRYTEGAALREGRITLEIAPLVENGNAVPVSVSVADARSPGEQVRSIALFAEHNPAPEVLVFHVGPHLARAAVSTRMRLARSQQVVAVARLADGSALVQRVDVVVTLAACIEGV